MATQGRGQVRRQTTYRRNDTYVQGNTVRKIQEVPRINVPQERQVNRAVLKNRDKARHMNIGSIMFLSAALFAVGFILVGYIGLQSDITNSIKHISSLESQLNDLKLANDEEYSRISSSIDLEEVKRIAIQELGMSYAEEGQIVYFSGEDSDYVRQLAEIPE